MTITSKEVAEMLGKRHDRAFVSWLHSGYYRKSGN